MNCLMTVYRDENYRWNVRSEHFVYLQNASYNDAISWCEKRELNYKKKL